MLYITIVLYFCGKIFLQVLRIGLFFNEKYLLSFNSAVDTSFIYLFIYVHVCMYVCVCARARGCEYLIYKLFLFIGIAHMFSQL